VGGEAPIQQLGQSAADHRSHGLRRMRREIKLCEGLVQRRGKVEHGIGQRAVEIEDDRFRPLRFRTHQAARACSALCRIAAMLSA